MRVVQKWLWPVLGVASLFLLWAGLIAAFDVKPFVAPGPMAVVNAI
ncbi:MAG: hypothetical protein JWQ17_6108, partial [Tardiphaga sp.]|nr:hypothetical protein [Tardiphaga sp.]